LRRAALVGLILLTAAPAVAGDSPETAKRPEKAAAYSEVGWASWYGDELRGRRTADGERFSGGALTAAHKTLPLPCYARVTNLRNHRSIVVRVNDRGPFVNDRLVDVSARAASLLGFRGVGLAKVRVDYIGATAPPAAEPSTLLAGAATRAPLEDGVSAYGPTLPAGNAIAAVNALAAADRAANPPSPEATPAPASPYGVLVPFPAPFGGLVPAFADDVTAEPFQKAATALLMADSRL
jgi:rare lipoprotein A